MITEPGVSPIRLGILSTAHINRLLIPGAHASDGTSSRRSAPRSRSFSTTRGTVRTPVIELRRDGNVERIELDPADSYRLELENLAAAIRGQAPLLLGREDAVAQARALEPLHRSAETGTQVLV